MNSEETQAQLVVLGAGPGGYTAAFRAADLGLDVTLVERDPMLGGVCLNVGCIPSKALLHAARVLTEASAIEEAGILFGKPRIDLDRLRQWKDGIVERLSGGLSGLAKARKITVVRGSGRFLDEHRLAVVHEGTTTVLRFEQCIVAAGSEPVALPFLPDDERIMDSTGALELAEIPERLLVIGGGIIGLEMATVYDALGSRVSVVEALDQLMPGADKDLVKPLARRLGKRLASIQLGAKATRVVAGSEGLEVEIQTNDATETSTFDRILVAVGRRPNGRLLDLDKAGIAMDERGFVIVDESRRTNRPHIFAIGDVTPGPMLAHKALAEAKVAAEVAAGKRRGLDTDLIPSVAYTDPEVAWVGVTEEQAKARGLNYDKGVFPWAASGRSLSMGREEGLTKLLFDRESGRVIGCGIVGPNAGDLIAEATLAIEMGADATDLAHTVHPHPTLSETLPAAAEMFEGSITDLLAPKSRGGKRS
jgi:dihydrolipoamide dehydrogenase